MAAKSKSSCIGILTSGGDCPGLNAAIRAVAKAAINEYGMTVIGFMDGFRGLVENRMMIIEPKDVSGILTVGGTILGTSRDKLHKMPMGNQVIDMTDVAVENLRKNHIECLVCLGGGGTMKNAFRLHKAGNVNVITLPKTIDNDVVETDVSFGYDTALQIATDAIDRLHTTATSHHRMIVCEIMGHRAGWLALGSGIAGGADVILIPEIPYDLSAIADYLLERRRRGSKFSIIAIAEGAVSVEDIAKQNKKINKKTSKKKTDGPVKVKTAGGLSKEIVLGADKNGDFDDLNLVREPIASRIARHLHEMTSIEARVTSLGHVQRGGIPSAFDRLLCSRLGTKAAELLAKGVYNVMVGYCAGECKPIPLEKVAGKTKIVPIDHPMIKTAQLVGTCMGDKNKL